jgi:8-oxo-dGTP pyrophosphatase MutT (NUDIX family)
VNVTHEELRQNLGSFSPRLLPSDEGVRAAVALIVVRGDQEQVILTRRATKLRAHPGQWALPGGRLQPGECAEEAARREAFEEVGVSLATGDRLGRLDDYKTRSGYIISPFVFGTPAPVTLTTDAREVAEVHLVPLSTVDVDPEYVDYGVGQESVLRMPFGGRFIHAPTGAILFQFREVGLHGRSTRVDAVEEPFFAWK